MPVLFVNRSTVFGLTVPFDLFPELVRQHLTHYPSTPDVETLGTALIAADFRDDDTEDFVKRVCEWGGYPGIWGRVLKDNLSSHIAQALREAAAQLSGHPPAFAAALTRLNQIRGLGKPSFASKHLRFLRPEVCPVLDSELCVGLPYSPDPDGYSDFASDCIAVARRLEAERIPNPRGRPDQQWYAADVEAALFIAAKTMT